MKFGLLSYDYTTNLGNEIQSIAARRFLPRIDYFIEHEKLDRFSEDENVKLIMNAWYLDCKDAWPPSENIDPLLISMHFTTGNDERRNAILTDESREFFEINGPVGCRDYHTLNFLQENDIDSYFSGCLTLTLDSGKKRIENDEEYVVVNVANPNELLSYLKQRTQKKVYFIYQDMIPSYEKALPETCPAGIYTLSSLYDYEEKLFMAENLLKIYENASCVITDRLHCALPCLAFEVPVLLLENDRMQERFEGIHELLHRSTFEEYLGNYSIFDVDNPPQNSKDYLKIRNDLIKRCEDFTGCVNDSCYTDISYESLLCENSLRAREIIEMQQDKIRSLNSQINGQKKSIADLNREIDKLNHQKH